MAVTAGNVQRKPVRKQKDGDPSEKGREAGGDEGEHAGLLPALRAPPASHQPHML